jgi:4-hydroxybenzoate polyprenyltransferase
MKDEATTTGQEPNATIGQSSGSSFILPPSSFLSRWWTYQGERFPIVAHGVLILAFSSSAVCFSSLLRGRAELPPLLVVTVAFGTAFLFFLQLRIADEFKDFEEDSRYRPYRAVPRGLVSLRELGVLGIIAAAIQLLLGLALDPSIVLLLAVAWVYLALMSKEFFVGEWLKQHPVPYLISHMVIIPLVDFYATACDWWPVGDGMPRGLGWFVAASYANGIVIEVGRKIRAPADEEVGVNTYSTLWGPRTAVLVWLGAMLTTAICATLAAAQIDFVIPVATVLTMMLLTAGLVVWRFLSAPTSRRSKLIETLAGVWTILLYLSVGAAPLLWRWYQSMAND